MAFTLGSKNMRWSALIFGALGLINLLQGEWTSALIWGGIAAAFAIQPPTNPRLQIAYIAALIVLVTAIIARIISLIVPGT